MRYTEEDWERTNVLEEMYLIEKQIEIETQWQEWIETHEKHPAVVKTKRRKEHESNIGTCRNRKNGIFNKISK